MRLPESFTHFKFTAPAGALLLVLLGLSAPALTPEAAALGTSTTLTIAGLSGPIESYPPGGPISTITNLGAAAEPDGIAYDAVGNLFVANYNTGVINKITPGGTVSTFATLTANEGTVGLAFGPGGNLYVSNYSSGVINEISPSGTVSTFASLGTAAKPQFIAFDTKGNLYVANSGPGTITEIKAGGQLTLFATVSGSATSQGLTGLAFDASGNLFAADQNTGIISKISPDGSTVTNFAALGTAKAPAGIAFDPSGNLYTSDTSDIDKITASGTASVYITDGNQPYDVTFGKLSVVPEPSAWAMMLGGGSLLGLTLRRRSRARFA